MFKKFIDRTDSDKNFFHKYNGTKSCFGVAAYDGDILVGYSIGVQLDTEYCLSAFNKILRGYTNLGLQISYEKAQLVFEKGFKYMNLGSINNDFKKQFIPIAQQRNLYGTEICRDESFKTLSPYGYTPGLLW